MADILTTEPTSIRAGDTWAWTRSLSDYPAPTWTLKYRFRHPSNAGFEIVASASGTDHAVSVAAATTTGYTAGTYAWLAWVENGATKTSVDEGRLEVKPDYRSGLAAATYDARSDARIVYEALIAEYKARAAAGRGFVGEYEIAGRRMRFANAADMIKAINFWAGQVRAEDAAADLANGTGSGRVIGVRF